MLLSAGLADAVVAARRTGAAAELRALAGEVVALPDRTGEARGEGGEDRFAPASRPEVRLGDVAGLDEVKEEIRLRMVLPFRHPEAAARYGVRPGGGVLLYGPPGTGKTLLARAVAGEIEADFFTVRPSDLLSKWVGEAEKNVAALFAQARARPRSVVFIDEVEALLPVRPGDASSVMSRVVPQILGELDGFAGRRGGLLFLGATNAPWNLDPAVLRPGRFDVTVYVGLPDAEARAGILLLTLAGRPVAPDFDPAAVASALAGWSGADLRRLAEKAAGESFLAAVRGGDPREITTEDLLAVAATMRPSVTGDALRRYEEWRSR